MGGLRAQQLQSSSPTSAPSTLIANIFWSLPKHTLNPEKLESLNLKAPKPCALEGLGFRSFGVIGDLGFRASEHGS